MIAYWRKISKQKITKKVKASTLIESLVAMVIILIVFALFINVFSSKSINTKQTVLFRSFVIANQMMEITRDRKLFLDMDTLNEGLKIVKKCSSIENKSVQMVEIYVYCEDRLVVKQSAILLK